MVLVECQLTKEEKKGRTSRKGRKDKKEIRTTSRDLEVNPNEDDGFDEEHGEDE